MIEKYIRPVTHFFSTTPSNNPIGTANAKAVNTESCRGERFLMENIKQSYKRDKEQGSGIHDIRKGIDE